MDICNTYGAALTLPAIESSINFLIEEHYVIAQKEILLLMEGACSMSYRFEGGMNKMPAKSKYSRNQ